MESQRAREATPGWLALLVGLVGIVAGLALPFCPVRAQTTTLTWPVPGQPVVSSSAIVVPTDRCTCRRRSPARPCAPRPHLPYVSLR
ncbi:hypothetical protein ACRYGS_05665 [Mycobacteroides abscessus]